MSKKSNFNAELTSAQVQVMMVESYLKENYLVRRNVLSNDYEYCQIGATPSSGYAPLSQTVINSIAIEVMKLGVEGSVFQLVDKVIHSMATPDYNPITDYLFHLPEWDGKDRLDALFYRIPGISAEQVCFCTRWLRSAVAHWMGLDEVYGNQSVLLLIGQQGCGKSTFAQKLLPPHLRRYYLDHLNIANKNDKEMALSDCLLVNIDEFDQVKASQQAELKHTITKPNVNGRKIYGRTHTIRPRMASFIATTNNSHPLKDVTGSRRYISIKVTNGQLIDNRTDIDYEQVYAQLIHELREDKQIYWFTEEENVRLQHLNQHFYAKIDFEDIIQECIRKPKDDEDSQSMTSYQILTHANSIFPGIEVNRRNQTLLGSLLSSMGVTSKRSRAGNKYDVVALSA